MRRTLTRYLREAIATTGSAAGGPDPDADWDTFQLADVEREVLVFTSFWLGLTNGMANTSAEQVTAAFDDAVGTVRGPYRSGAPTQLLRQLEDFAAGIEFERRTERRRVRDLERFAMQM